ncbi:hypothetical protein [Absidia glauca]|uniref:Uncharacterized protein n=1 Tax=Absidia glauca TaxID=4829 RepID=A0A168Q1E3_ABSGL|nr:hypothetical protein [Absidia glauca]
MSHKEMYIYRKTLNLKYVCGEFFSERYTKPQNSDLFQWPNNGVSSTKSQYCLHHSVDTKHQFFHVKFEVGFVTSFMRKRLSNKIVKHSLDVKSKSSQSNSSENSVPTLKFGPRNKDNSHDGFK